VKISKDEAVRHLQDVISHFNDTDLENARSNISEIEEVYVRLRAAVLRLSPPDSEYEREAQEILANVGASNVWQAENLYGIAKSLKRDYEQGFISATFAALVRADLFNDFLEMADHLLSSNFKDPAAVIIGTVLEEHLRKLCVLHGIPPTENGKMRRADALNVALASKNVYSKLDQKSVTAWQDLRNKAAHGEFISYTDSQVDLMLKSVRDFVSRYPA